MNSMEIVLTVYPGAVENFYGDQYSDGIEIYDAGVDVGLWEHTESAGVIGGGSGFSSQEAWDDAAKIYLDRVNYRLIGRVA